MHDSQIEEQLRGVLRAKGTESPGPSPPPNWSGVRRAPERDRWAGLSLVAAAVAAVSGVRGWPR